MSCDWLCAIHHYKMQPKAIDKVFWYSKNWKRRLSNSLSNKVSIMEPRMFWEDFSFDFRLDQQDLFGDLISIEAYRQAALNLVLPPEWSKQLDRLNRVRAVYGTTALEGNPLSEAEVDATLALAGKGLN